MYTARIAGQKEVSQAHTLCLKPIQGTCKKENENLALHRDSMFIQPIQLGDKSLNINLHGSEPICCTQYVGFIFQPQTRQVRNFFKYFFLQFIDKENVERVSEQLWIFYDFLGRMSFLLSAAERLNGIFNQCLKLHNF